MIFESISIVLLGHNAVEFVEVEVLIGLSVVDNVGVVHHLSELIIVQGLSQLSCNFLKTVEVSYSLALAVPELENFSDTFFGLGIANLRADNF